MFNFTKNLSAVTIKKIENEKKTWYESFFLNLKKNFDQF